jgi:predicted kinase
MATFIMLMGLPGSGKSYYAKEYTKLDKDAIIISSDDIRQELWGDANDQSNPSKIFETMFDRTVEALKSGKNVIYDATNLIAKTRKSTLTRLRQIFKEDLYSALYLITCSISECKRRQGDRERKVPEEVIDRMVRQFQAPWYNEGWDVIFTYNSGKMQNIDREHWRMLGESHDNHHHTLSLELHCSTCEAYMRKEIHYNNDVSTREKMMLIEAAYHHDIGKHKTKAFKDSRDKPSDEAHYYSHDNVGAYLWLSGDKGINWTKDEFLFIGLLIQWHMQPYFLFDKEGNYKENLKFWCDKKGFNDFFYKCICLLHEADSAAH